MRALFDLNVVVDVTLDRPGLADESAAAVTAVESGRVDGYLAAHSVTTLHYLLERDLGRAKTRRVLGTILDIFRVAAVDEDRLRESLAMGWRDFEDAVQASCADAVGAEVIVTRNRRDFRKSTVRTISPAELVALAG